MKTANILVSMLLLCLFLFSCGKKGNDPAPIDNGSIDNTTLPPGEDEKQGISIEMALFTDPAKVELTERDSTLMDTLVHYMNCALKGSDVYVNIFEFDYLPLINAVKNANSRGVVMHVMLDNSSEASITKTRQAIEILQPALKPPSELVVVRSDANEGSINHHKHAFFSELNLPQGIARNVVFSTSENFTLSDMKKGQDAVVLTNKGLYDAFLANWNDMAARAQHGMANFEYKSFDIEDNIQACFFPRRHNGKWDGNDNITEILSKLHPGHYSEDTILLGMNGWTWRRLHIAEQLTRLQESGVTVEVITKSAIDREVLDELDNLEQKGGYVKILPYPRQNIHSKFMLIKGVWEGKKQEIVICGSHNYTSSALKHNNELLLMLKNRKLFLDYVQFFNKMKEIE